MHASSMTLGPKLAEGYLNPLKMCMFQNKQWSTLPPIAPVQEGANVE